MRKTMLGSLTGLLIPFAAYAAQIGYGAYQRRQPAHLASHLPLSPVGQYKLRPESTAEVDENELKVFAGSPVKELVIIDSAVPDKAVLGSATRPGIETVILQAGADALEQITVLLQNYRSLDAVHLVSHGEAGAILLGDQRIDKSTLENRPQFLTALGAATRAGADLLLYACDLASEDSELLEMIQRNSHLDIAASNNLTGAAGLGGDWTLEIQAGNIETAQAFSGKALQDFSAVLRPFGTKTFESWNGEYYTDDPTKSWDGFTTYISTVGAYEELLSGTVCGADLYVSMYDPNSRFLTRSTTIGEAFGVTSLGIRTTGGGGSATQVSIIGYNSSDVTVGTKNSVAVSTTPATIDLTTGITGSFADIVRFRIQPNDDHFCLTSIAFTPLDSDGNLTAAAGVSEPVGLSTTVDTVGEAVNVFDFTISDGGASDAQALTVSQVVVSVSGTSTDTERGKITWRLNGPDVSNVTGTYSSGADTITFSGLSVSVADGGNETYTINAYYNDNTSLTEDRTIILSVDGDTNLTVGASGTQMGSTSAVTNGTGTTIDVTATQLVFATQPAGSVSGAALSTQPVVAARDAAGNTDVDFTETVTLTEASAGSLSNNTQAASGGVATFTNLNYTATADQQSFTLTANDQDGVGSNLPTVDANSVTSNVVATKLLYTTQPVPTSVISGAAMNFTTDPVVSATDANNIVDTGYATGIVLSVTDPNDGIVDGTVNSMTGTGDTDGSGTTVTLTPSSGVATYTGLQLTYTASGGSNFIALRATSGGLTAANSSTITAAATPVVTDGNISISGASGTGGAYKTGDTVTTTWNNTAGGDNNAGVTGVTVDFSQFGGGAAVAATNSSDTWTATYTIISGAIDTTNRNVSVTATNASGDTTTADTSNATVDNITPTVSDARISISGASGTGGAYKIGDTVTATWNNTAGGDNNSDTISSVTVDFSAFGGGAAVAATNSSDTWTATYTIVSGAFDNTNRNVSVTATDNAGNATATADTTNATVDNIVPTVTNANISISGASGTGGAFIVGDTVTATWNNTAGGDNNSDTISSVTVDFSQFGGGAAVAATNSSGTWTATYTIVSGAIDATNRNVSVTATDNAGNSTTTADTTNATVDNQAATVGSVSVPANGTYTSGQNLDFTVNYSEAVTVNTTGGTPRLALTIGATARFASYLSGSGTTALVFRYTVQAGDSDSNGIALNGTLDTNGGTLTDDVGNAASTTLNSIGSLTSVLVDAQGPSVDSVSLPSSGTYTAGQNLNFTLNFGEAVTVNTGGGTPRLALTIGATARFASYLSGSGTTALVFRYTVQAGDNDSNGIALSATLDANGGTLRDSAGNDASTDLGTLGSLASVLVDTQAPAVGTNTGLSVIEDGSGTIGDNRLAATDNVSTATNITFTVDAIPANGTLLLSGGALSNGNTFTQDDIDNNLVTYDHNGSATASDSFDFTVRDAVNNSAASDTFSITIAPPEEPAITAPADLDIDATGLYTTVTLRQLLGLAANASDAAVLAARLALASDAADGADCCNPTALELSNGRIRLAPGAHTITWRATDTDGNTAEDMQTVNIQPLVSLGMDQVGVEGGQVELRIFLNGLSPVYPLDVPYEIDIANSSADVADHDLVDGQVQFTAGQTERTVTINLNADATPEGDEVLVVNLDDTLVNAGASDSHSITITEANIAPTVMLSLEQNGVDTALVTPTGGTVTVMAMFDDQNADMPTAYDWSMSDSMLIDGDGNVADAVFEFDPSALNPGVHRFHVAVGDGTATTTAALYFRVVMTLPNMGIDTGDADGDGIPDYLDNIDATNVLPGTAAQIDGYLIECDPGLRCRLGRHALLGSNGGARLTAGQLRAQDIEDDADYRHSGGIFDFEVHELPVAGQSVRVVIPLQGTIPAGAEYRKFDNNRWSTFVTDARNALHSAAGEPGYCPPPGDSAWRSGLRRGYRCIQLTIEDGGPNDADGDANRSIEDPGSVATLSADEEVTVYGVRSQGGGSADGFFLILLALAAILRGRRVWKGLAGGLLLLLLPVKALAFDWDSLWADSSFELGFYQADGSRGSGEFSDGLAADGVSAEVQTYDVSRGARQLVYAWQYRERLALRLAYLDLGDVTVDLAADAASDEILSASLSRHYPASAAGLVLAGRYEYPLKGRFDLFFDAGIYRWDSDIDLSDANGGNIIADMGGGTDPILGLGANYRITERYAAGLNWQRVFFSGQAVELWGLSGVFHF